MERRSAPLTELVEGSLANAEGKAKQNRAPSSPTMHNRAARRSRVSSRTSAATPRASASAPRQRSARPMKASPATCRVRWKGASGQFREATEELRAMTAQIQRELDTTRNETQSAAWRSCHRRPRRPRPACVVWWPIRSKALNELSSLVTPLQPRGWTSSRVMRRVTARK